jgi:hypothetical protein
MENDGDIIVDHANDRVLIPIGRDGREIGEFEMPFGLVRYLAQQIKLD